MWHRTLVTARAQRWSCMTTLLGARRHVPDVNLTHPWITLPPLHRLHPLKTCLAPAYTSKQHWLRLTTT
eukprot:9263154-Alexandrium_andersonii.AAC.1